MVAFLQVCQFVGDIISRNSAGASRNTLAMRISRLALSLLPCTREMVVCVPGACFTTCRLRHRPPCPGVGLAQ